MNDLLAKAHAAPRGDRHNYDAVADAVEVLRAKGWRYAAIHEWLLNEGAHIHWNATTFASAMSQRLKHRRKNQ